MKITQFSGALAALTLAGTVAACQQTATPEGQETTAAAAAPDAKPGFLLTDGRLVLPIIAGRPGAVYFKLQNGTDKATAIVSAYVEGAANAEIHETKDGSMAAVDKVEVPSGGTVEFAPGGLHIMAFELPTSLHDGGTTELTVSFADGDKISAPLSITTGKSATSSTAVDHDHHDGMEH